MYLPITITTRFSFYAHYSPEDCSSSIMPSNLCYLPGGSLDSESTPCNAEADASACCPVNDICLSNGFCFGARDTQPNLLTRASCSDETFSSQNCPQSCNTANPHGYEFLWPASFDLYYANSPSKASYCCNGIDRSNSSQCLAQTGGPSIPFAVPNENVITDRANGAQQHLNETAGKVLAGPPATGNAISSRPSNDQHHDVAVGVGVAVPLMVLLLLLLASLIWQLRQRKGLERSLALVEKDRVLQMGQRLPKVRARGCPKIRLCSN